MAAPTPTARVSPTGPKFKDGFKTHVTLAIDPNFEFWEKEVTPVGVQTGEAIRTGDMHNTAWETKAVQQLKELTTLTMTGSVTGTTLLAAAANCGIPTTVTLRNPNNSTIAFYGALRSFIPGPHVRGQQPTATITIEPTNTDPVDDSEAGPVYTAAP